MGGLAPADPKGLTASLRVRYELDPFYGPRFVCPGFYALVSVVVAGVDVGEVVLLLRGLDNRPDNSHEDGDVPHLDLVPYLDLRGGIY